MVCSQCGEQNPDEARFCRNCGAGLQANAVVASTTPMQYAGAWRRFVAAFIDSILIGIVNFIVAFILTRLGAGVVAQLAGIIIAWLYWAGMESSSKQATLGKQVMSIYVTDLYGNRVSFGRATGRHFAKFLSTLILLIGYIMILFTEKKQGLHDKIAGCLVVR